jgi:hypothetical protein
MMQKNRYRRIAAELGHGGMLASHFLETAPACCGCASKSSTRRPGYNSGYTQGMKTAVSMPDDLFRLAEATARRLKVSRSELYSKAIAEFLKSQTGNAITERLNAVYSQHPAKVDSGLHRAQLKSLEKDGW